MGYNPSVKVCSIVGLPCTTVTNYFATFLLLLCLWRSLCCFIFFFILLFLRFFAEHDVLWYGISLWSSWVNYPHYTIFKPLAPVYSFVRSMAKCEKGKILTLCKRCLTISITLLSHQQCFSHRHKTQHPMDCCEES